MYSTGLIIMELKDIVIFFCRHFAAMHPIRLSNVSLVEKPGYSIYNTDSIKCCMWHFSRRTSINYFNNIFLLFRCCEFISILLFYFNNCSFHERVTLSMIHMYVHVPTSCMGIPLHTSSQTMLNGFLYFCLKKSIFSWIITALSCKPF